MKISRDELLQRYTGTSRHYGYHGITMEMLSSACGLAKTSFYHHYPNKEASLHDVPKQTHQRLAETLLSIAYDPLLTPRERLEKLGHKVARLFQDDSVGYLMGVIAVGANYDHNELMAPIRSSLNDQAQALTQLYRPALGEIRALERGRQLVTDFEGTILLARIYDESGYIDDVTRRALEQLAGQPTSAFNLSEAPHQTVGTTDPHSES